MSTFNRPRKATLLLSSFLAGIAGFIPWSNAEDEATPEEIRMRLERQFDDLDANSDGEMDEQEAKAFSSRTLGRMRERGLKQGFPIPKEDFVEAGIAEDEYQRKRDREKAESREGKSDEKSRDSGEDTPGTMDAANPEDSIRSAPTGTRRLAPGRVAYTPSLPDAYKAKDKNGDGQIGLYEWERSKFSEFAKLDKNGDGFLTPVELGVKINFNPVASKTSSTPGGGIPGAPGGSGQSGSPEDEAKSRFSRLDSNGDGTLSAEEWANSRTTRGMFEQAGINPTFPLDVNTFSASYVKLRAASPSGDNNGGRGFGPGGFPPGNFGPGGFGSGGPGGFGPGGFNPGGFGPGSFDRGGFDRGGRR